MSAKEPDGQDQDARLQTLKQAAKEGFDELDQGRGIVLRGKKSIERFFKQVELEIKRKSS
jgi:hypothetical protein